MDLRITSALFASLAICTGFAQTRTYPRAMVSFDDFKKLVSEVEAHRGARLIDLNTFLRMSREPGGDSSRHTFRFPV